MIFGQFFTCFGPKVVEINRYGLLSLKVLWKDFFFFINNEQNLTILFQKNTFQRVNFLGEALKSYTWTSNPRVT